MAQYLTRHRPAGRLHASDIRDANNEALHRLLHMIAESVPAQAVSTIRRGIELLNFTWLAMIVRHDIARTSRDQPTIQLVR